MERAWDESREYYLFKSCPKIKYNLLNETSPKNYGNS